MKSLLVLNSSGRVTRSITRHLTLRFIEAWRKRLPDAEVVVRDVGLNPPPPVNETWIAGAFADPEKQTPAMRDTMAVSETLIGELFRADAIVIGVPMYNFGMPAQLKAYFDQVVRIGRTFAFDAGAAEPYQPLLNSKPVVVVTSAGDGALHPGGALAHMNHLEPHLKTLLGFIGLTDLSFIRVGYDEFQDERMKRSLAKAEQAVDETVGRLFNCSPETLPA